MSRTSHRWHYEVCPTCGRKEKVQNRSYRWVAPNDVVGAVTGYDVHKNDGRYVYGQWVPSTAFRRTTIHRLACAKKHGKTAYES